MIVHEQSVTCILQTQVGSPSPTSPFPPSLIFLTLPSPLLPSPLSFLPLPSSTFSLTSLPTFLLLPALPPLHFHPPFSLYIHSSSTFLTNFSDPLPHSRVLLIFHFLLLLLLFSPTPCAFLPSPFSICLHLFVSGPLQLPYPLLPSPSYCLLIVPPPLSSMILSVPFLLLPIRWKTGCFAATPTPRSWSFSQRNTDCLSRHMLCHHHQTRTGRTAVIVLSRDCGRCMFVCIVQHCHWRGIEVM